MTRISGSYVWILIQSTPLYGHEFIRYASKIVNEWNGHLVIFSLSQATENEILLRTDILQETVVGCSWWMTVTDDCLEVFSFSVTQSPFGFANVEILTVPTTSFIYNFGYLTAAVLAQSVERVDCRAGGRGFDSWGRTNTQGLKITEKWRYSLCTATG